MESIASWVPYTARTNRLQGIEFVTLAQFVGHVFLALEDRHQAFGSHVERLAGAVTPTGNVSAQRALVGFDTDSMFYLLYPLYRYRLRTSRRGTRASFSVLPATAG